MYLGSIETVIFKMDLKYYLMLYFLGRYQIILILFWNYLALVAPQLSTWLFLSLLCIGMNKVKQTSIHGSLAV